MFFQQGSQKTFRSSEVRLLQQAHCLHKVHEPVTCRQFQNAQGARDAEPLSARGPNAFTIIH